MKRAMPNIDEYIERIMNPKLVKANKLQNGSPVTHTKSIKGTTVEEPDFCPGQWCVVFPYNTAKKKYAVRCWLSFPDTMEERHKAISKYLNQKKIEFLPDFDYVNEGMLTSVGIVPITIMEWVNGVSLKKYIEDNLHNAKKMASLADNFKNMVSTLHTNKIAHGDLHHENILVSNFGKLYLVDYDSMYVPELEGYADIIHGYPGFQHPARFKNTKTASYLDYFAELVIYLTIKSLQYHPELWKKQNIAQTDALLFTPEDIDSLGSAAIFRELLSYPQEDIVQLTKQMLLELHKNDLSKLLPLEEILTNAHIPKKDIDDVYGGLLNVYIKSDNNRGSSDDMDEIIAKQSHNFIKARNAVKSISKDDDMEKIINQYTTPFFKKNIVHCTTCGKELDSDEEFCIKCGTKRID